MKEEHYPSLFRSADAASVSAQKTYLRLQKAHLGSLILGSIIGAFTALATNVLSVWLYSAMAIILAFGLLILWVKRSRQDDKAWFDCRAVAESVKTTTWRFMMNVPPFHNSDSIEERFVSELREIRKARPDFGKLLASVMDARAFVITDFMRQIRSHSFDERKRLYIEGRLRDQKSWYTNKANMNALNGTRWYWVTTGLQSIAVTIAIVQAAFGAWGFNAVPLLTTCAAAVVAWGQTKRYDELAKTYALAAQELGELEAIADGITHESNFPQFVEQVEEAISREHTLWRARRDVALGARATKRTR